MDEKTISLCISYPSWGDPDRQMLFRIADYYPEENTMYQVPFDDPEYADGAKRIGFHPRDAYPYMAELREWEYAVDDSNKTYSYLYSKNIYEIVFLPELETVEYANASAIRRVLTGGFTLDESVSENLLLVIGRTETHYAVLQCRKKDLRRVNGNVYAFASDIRDMIHAMHYLKEYDILDSQIISTDNQYISLTNGKAATRYFYNSTALPDSIGIFHIVDFSKYIPLFITNYIKKNKETAQFSSSEIRKITDLLEVIFADQKHREEFFSCTGFTSEKLEELLPQHRALLAELLLNDSSVETVIKRSLLEDDAVWTRCVDLVRTAWMKEQDAERTRIQGELQALTREKEELDAAILKNTKKKQELETDIATFEEQFATKKAELEKIQADIEAELAAFSDNIVHSTAVCAVAQKFSSGRGASTHSDADIVIITPVTTDKNDPLDDRDDFQEALADNLMSIGYDEDIVDAMAQLITYSLTSYLPILLSGNEDDVAQCIAAMFGSSIVTLNISNNNKPTDYIDGVQSALENNSVILVNGAFSGMSVEHFNAIRYHFAEKGYIVLFSLDGVEVEMLPKMVFEKSTFLDCHQKITSYTFAALNGYKANLTDLSSTASGVEVGVQLKKLEPLIASGIINRLVAANYAKFMAEIDCNIKKDWLVALQICVYAKSTHKTEVLVEVFDEMGIEFEELKYYL